MAYRSSRWTTPNFGSNRKEFLLNFGLLVLRVGTGALLLFGHGSDKLVNFAAKAPTFADPFGVGSSISLGLAVFAEFFCSLAIALGFATRLAVIPLLILLCTAAFIIHGGDPWARKELAMVYLVPYLTLLFTGPGRYSLDYLFFGKKHDGI
jgi:putative oxidoreductase